MFSALVVYALVNSLFVHYAASQSCPAGTFKGSLNGTVCSKFVKRIDLLSAEKCRLACCLNTTCGGWLWCPDTGKGAGCNGWASSRCHLGNPNGGGCKPATHWIGETKTAQTPTPAPHFPTPPPHHPTPGPVPPRPPASKKQGFSGFLGQHYNCDDAEALNLGHSWYYTWLHMMSQYNKCKDSSKTYEFAPMVIGVGTWDQISAGVIRQWAPFNPHFLLGYNEPDYGNGHNHPHMVDPAIAAKDWPNVQKLAAQANLTLVSPAPSTTGIDDTGKSEWLDQFLANCTTEVAACDPSSIKYIAFHDYTGNVSRILSRSEGAYKRYGRKVWITEFAINKWACKCDPTRQMQDAYMKEVLPLLEKSDAVFRYDWYSARDAPSPDTGGGNLLVWNVSKPTLTSTGQIYADFAKEKK